MTRPTARRLLIACLGLALVLPAASFAWPGWDRGDRAEHADAEDRDEGHRAARMQKKLDGLDLAPDARAEVQAILERAHETRRHSHPEHREAKQKLRALMHDAQSSEAELLAQAERVADLGFARSRARIQTHLALRDLLSAEQLESLRPRRHRGDGGEGHAGECRGKGSHRKDRGDR